MSRTNQDAAMQVEAEWMRERQQRAEKKATVRRLAKQEVESRPMQNDLLTALRAYHVAMTRHSLERGVADTLICEGTGDPWPCAESRLLESL